MGQEVIIGPEAAKPSNGSSGWLFARFVLLGSLFGLAVGFIEASLIYFTPSNRAFEYVDITYVIWFLAPLLDLGLFTLVGVILGWLAVIKPPAGPRRCTILASVLIVGATTHLAFAIHFLRSSTASLDVFANPGLSYEFWSRLPIAILGALLLGRLFWRRFILSFSAQGRNPVTRTAVAVCLISAFLLFGLVSYNFHRTPGATPVLAEDQPHNQKPNIVLITLDTVRADHLSAYGYPRRTTPNIDQLASRGVLFENAISAAPWTLPSTASIFTGLLPHQHGADSYRPMDTIRATIAEVLRKRGYETAGFNANYSYGQGAWGLAKGFDLYDGDRLTISYNLSRTLVGRLLIQPIYEHFIRYDVFFRRDAKSLNKDVFRWLDNQSGHPFFLYVNYLDAHDPYWSTPPYNKIFGKYSSHMARRQSFGEGFYHMKPLAAADQSSLIAGYDNSLAYTDAQVGELLKRLASTPNWKNTYVLLTSDHGEAFGEHGFYRHGCDLHLEEIHVPLVIAGPGIPEGKRIFQPVGNRRVFATALDFGLGNNSMVRQESLATLWDSSPPVEDAGTYIVSELSPSLRQANLGEVSLITPFWHYIRKATGEQELYQWPSDPEEKLNLAQSQESGAVLMDLFGQLQERLGLSIRPWQGREFLSGMNTVGCNVFLACMPVTSLEASDLRGERPIGTTQGLFSSEKSQPANLPAPGDKDLLLSLPYD